MPRTSTLIPYTPETWTPEQLVMHRPADLDAAFHSASCLAGGWYQRPVVIGMRIITDSDGESDEDYAIAPAHCELPDGYEPAYKVERLGR